MPSTINSNSETVIVEDNQLQAYEGINLVGKGYRDPSRNWGHVFNENFLNLASKIKNMISSVYTKSEIDNALSYKANKTDKLPLVDYSYNEHKVGCRWVDGKPIYRIVAKVPTPPVANIWTNSYALPADCESIVSYKYDVEWDNNDAQKNSPLIGYDGWNLSLGFNLGYFRMYIISGMLNYKGFLILEYTKTTDNAQSAVL